MDLNLDDVVVEGGGGGGVDDVAEEEKLGSPSSFIAAHPVVVEVTTSNVQTRKRMRGTNLLPLIELFMTVENRNCEFILKERKE